MKLTFDGDYGYTGDEVRAFAQTPHPVSGVMYAQPYGSYESRAIAEDMAHMARWKAAAFADAARSWDAGTAGASSFAPNPFLGENLPPPPGQPHPVK